MILHFANNNSFIGAYIEFIRNNFDIKNHLFLINGNIEGLQEDETINLFVAPSIGKFRKFRKEIKPYFEVADKVILHGLFIPNLVFFLYFNRKYLSKCYWIIYGGDLYYYKFNSKRLWSKFYEIFRKFVIKNFGNIIMYAEGDYALAKKWYKTKAKFHECLFYPYLGVYDYLKNIHFESKQVNKINIMIGNSADPSNNHIIILQRLTNLVFDQNIRIICPLSYGGSKEYIEKVIEFGKEKFDDKFIPLVNFLSKDKYYKILSDVDIAIFNHYRQQATGNILSLLYFGKKVYVNKEENSTTWGFLKKYKFKFFDFNDFNLDVLSEKDQVWNKAIIKSKFNYFKTDRAS